ncbi:MAG TPA: hypothetical protein VES67_09365 [Vicinamibacterales bacterium]|nr:hypothetical protein [Vicinamibacterales bacterium]
MSRRIIAAIWLVVGVVIFNAFFDLYVSRGAREYLQKRAEYELRGGPEPDMDTVMAQSTQDGWIMSTLWAGLVVAGGWTTLWAVRSKT